MPVAILKSLPFLLIGSMTSFLFWELSWSSQCLVNLTCPWNNYPWNELFQDDSSTEDGGHIFGDIVLTTTPGNFRSCFLQVIYHVPCFSHCWIQCASSKVSGTPALPQDPDHPEHRQSSRSNAHIRLHSSFSSFSSWTFHEALGWTKGSSALCFFHEPILRCHAAHLIFTRSMLLGSYRN